MHNFFNRQTQFSELNQEHESFSFCLATPHPNYEDSGYGRVSFSTLEEAEKAIAAMNGKDMIRYRIQVALEEDDGGEGAGSQDKNLSNGLFFLELLSAVEPRVVNWNLVTKGETDEKKKLNATYIISVARKLGCSIFLLPEDIMERQAESSPSPSITTPDLSPAPSINGDKCTFDESSARSINGDASSTPAVDPSPAPSFNGEDSTTQLLCICSLIFT